MSEKLTPNQLGIIAGTLRDARTELAESVKDYLQAEKAFHDGCGVRRYHTALESIVQMAAEETPRTAKAGN